MTNRTGVLVIVAVFLAASIYPILQERAYSEFATEELIQIKKMLDYGFVKTHGIVPYNHAMTGRLTHPEAFNYTHHPLPRTWLYAATYHLFGGFGVTLFNVALGLVQSLFVYAALKRQFQVLVAAVVASFYACAPAMQSWAVGPTSIILMVMVWPVAAWLILPPPGQSQPGKTATFWLGVTMFLAGQVSWSMGAIVPSLLLMSAQPGRGWKDTIGRNFRNRLWWAIILGAGLSAIVFLAQIVIFTPNASEPFKYARRFGGGAEGGLKLIAANLLRIFVLISPPLVIGGLMGLRASLRPRHLSLGALAMLAYIVLFLVGQTALPYFFTVEKWMLMWLLFPAAYLTACWLSTARIRAAVCWLALLALPGILYIQVTASMPKLSRTTQLLARYLTEHTNPDDLVVMDLRWQQFPFRYWDQFGINWLADRLAFYDVNSIAQVEDYRERFRGHVARTLFLHQDHGTPDPALLQKVKEGQLLGRVELPLPEDSQTAGGILRLIYLWRQKTSHGTLANDSGGPTNKVVALELYQLP